MDPYFLTPVGKALIKEYGEPPKEYNGVVGDSCECQVCQLRRKVHGPDVLQDMNKGMFPDESLDTVEANYAKEGKAVPDAATIGDRVKRAAEETSKAKLDPTISSIVATFPGAREAVVGLFGPDHPNVKTMDELYKVFSNPAATNADKAKAGKTLQPLMRSVEAALAKEDLIGSILFALIR